jgi:membrane fusion protein, multidrug efflux system
MRVGKLLLLALAIAGGATGAWFFLRSDPSAPGKKSTGPGPVPVLMTKAQLRDVPLTLEVTGRTAAFESVTLKARVDGQVLAVPFAEGQHVRRGDVLLRLDPADFLARLRQAEANLARDQALAAKTQADVERYLALKAKGFVSDEKVGEVRSTATAAAATVRADQAAADVARLQLDYATLRAPFDGIVGARLVFPGSAVKVNDTALAVVNRIRPIHVAFAVPERHLPNLRAGMATSKTALKAAVSLPGDKSTPLIGEVRFVDNAVDAATGTIQMKATLANETETLTAGQFVNVALTLETLVQAVTVPTEAVQQGPEGSFLYVVGDDGAAQLRKVRLAATQAGLAVIAEGLTAGETVVTDGQLRLTPGAKVKPAGAGEANDRAAAKPAQ